MLHERVKALGTIDLHPMCYCRHAHRLGTCRYCSATCGGCRGRCAGD